MSDLKYLIGKAAIGIMINDKKDVLLLQFSDGSSEILRAVGGCCSKSWVQHIENVSAFIERPRTYGISLNTIESIEMIETRINTDADDDIDTPCLRVYGFKIKTKLGVITIELRNESNGYYSGWFERGFVDQYSCFPEETPLNLKQLQEDF